MKLLRGLGLALIGLTIAFLVGEGLLRLFLTVAPTPESSPYVVDPKAAYRLRPTPVELFDDPNCDHINALGFRGREYAREKPRGSYRVLGIGDSFVYGNVPLEDNFLRVAERVVAEQISTLGDTARVEIIPMGAGGYGPDNEVGILESVGLGLHPDLVVLNFFVGNDIVGLAMPARVYRGRLYFVGSLNPWVNLARKSRILLLGEDTLVRLLRGGELQQSRGAASGVGDTGAVKVNGTYLGIQKKRMSTYLKDPDRKLQGLWRRAEHYLLEFDRVCRENGIPWVLYLVPAEVQVDPDVADQVFRGLGLDPDEYDLDLPQRKLGAFCGSHGIPVLDPLSHLREQHRPDARLYIPNDTHWSVRGNRLAGEFLGGFIASNLPPVGVTPHPSENATGRAVHVTETAAAE
ncbi:MAG: hypothetical protein JXB46_04490 [Candidatus Eisenbacteria bacterium]|nr:hypothetical protein [Candidatus Eisenbacteria bacterium]